MTKKKTTSMTPVAHWAAEGNGSAVTGGMRVSLAQKTLRVFWHHIFCCSSGGKSLGMGCVCCCFVCVKINCRRRRSRKQRQQRSKKGHRSRRQCAVSSLNMVNRRRSSSL